MDGRFPMAILSLVLTGLLHNFLPKVVGNFPGVITFLIIFIFFLTEDMYSTLVRDIKRLESKIEQVTKHG